LASRKCARRTRQSGMEWQPIVELLEGVPISPARYSDACNGERPRVTGRFAWPY
jgi:hypothetical protein